MRYVARMATRYRALKGPIAFHRERAGLTVEQLADAVGVHRSTLTEQINGNRPMPWAIAARIAVRLDVPPDVLVEENGHEVVS